MKTLILYESKHGGTKEIAEMLGERIENSVVARIQNFVGDPIKYDRIIIGGPIYMGRVSSVVMNYIKRHEKIIDQVFVSGLLHEMSEKEVHDNFTDEFIKEKHVEFIGGSLHWDDMNFLEKLIVKIRTKKKESTSEYDMDSIERIVKGAY